MISCSEANVQNLENQSKRLLVYYLLQIQVMGLLGLLLTVELPTPTDLDLFFSISSKEIALQSPSGGVRPLGLIHNW